MARQQFTPEDFEGFVDDLSSVIAAGEADGRDMGGLTKMRKAMRSVAAQIEEAEKRGYSRAQTESQSRGVLAAKGVPEIAASYFSETDLTDTAAVDARIQELSSQGIRFEAKATPSGTPPSPAGAPTSTPPQQAPPAPTGMDRDALAKALANVQITPGMTPDAIIAAAVGQMTQAQAGGTPPGTTGDLETRIKAAAADPSKLDADARYALADELNKELDGLSAASAGRPLLG